MGGESHLEIGSLNDPCDISKPYLLAEHKEKIKECMDSKIEKFSKDALGTLKKAGTYEITEYLIKIGIEYVNALYEERPEEANPLIEDIWINNHGYVKELLFTKKFENENMLITIRSVLCDKEWGNLFESLLIFTDAIGMMEKHFKSNEVILYQLRSELSMLHNRGMYERTVVNLPSDEMIKANPVSRGDLKIEVEVSKPLIVAGEQFSVFVSIQNPFEVPVIVYSVETMIPVELMAISQIGNETEKSKGVAEGFATIDRDSLSKGQKPAPYLLQPDDRICKQIVLTTKGDFPQWRMLSFTPIKLLLEIQVRYGVDYRTHFDTVKTELDIQVGLKAIMAGAIIGGILGGFVRLWSDKNYDFGISNLSYIAISVAFSAMAVVAFARKTGVQKIVSIEDFFGGLLIGFFVGFQGPEWAKNLIFGGDLSNGNLPGNNSTNETVKAIAEMANETINDTSRALRDIANETINQTAKKIADMAKNAN